jgi:hypothetical protein
VKNYGFEALVNAQVLNRSMFAWDVTFSGAHNTNKLVTLGKDPTGKDIPPIIGTTISQKARLSAQQLLDASVQWSDANGDGIITPSEVAIGDTAILPGLLAAAARALAHERLRPVQHGGCASRRSWTQEWLQGAQLGAAVPLPAVVVVQGHLRLECAVWRQARAVANRFTSGRRRRRVHRDNTSRAFASSRPVQLARSVHRRSTSALAAQRQRSVRNLAVFSDWTGVDPEQELRTGRHAATAADCRAAALLHRPPQPHLLTSARTHMTTPIFAERTPGVGCSGVGSRCSRSVAAT